MAKFTAVDERVETKSEKRVRIFLAVLFFIQTVMTTFPFTQGVVELENGAKAYQHITALNLLIQTGGYQEISSIPLALIGGILVIFPMVAFFFCVLDSKSRIKYLISGLCSVVCAVVIVFTLAKVIAIGGIITLILNVITLFMTMQGLQATNMRMKQQEKK